LTGPPDDWVVTIILTITVIAGAALTVSLLMQLATMVEQAP